MTIYILAFDHLDGDETVRPINVEGENAADLAQAVHRHARGYLGSRRVDVRLDEATLTGSVVRGGIAVGEFALLAAEEQAAAGNRSADDEVTDVAQARSADPLHGYTLADIYRLTRWVITADRWTRAADVSDRMDAVRFAIVEHLCAATDPPTWRDLIGVGMRASDRYVNGELRAHGYLSADPGAGSGASHAFQRYWWGARVTPSPEDRVVDRVALEQIWPRLTRREQQAFETVAATEGFEHAAQAMGVTAESLRVRVRDARRHFLTHWHDGEAPSKPWRAGSHDVVKRLDVRGRARLTVSQVEALRARYEAGERLRVLAGEAGVAVQTLSALLRGTRRPAPDQEVAA